MEALASAWFDTSPLECIRTSEKPNAEQSLSLRKLICLSEASFEFLDKSCLEGGNSTAVELEAVARAFSFFFSVEKGQTR